MKKSFNVYSGLDLQSTKWALKRRNVIIGQNEVVWNDAYYSKPSIKDYDGGFKFETQMFQTRFKINLSLDVKTMDSNSSIIQATLTNHQSITFYFVLVLPVFLAGFVNHWIEANSAFFWGLFIGLQLITIFFLWYQFYKACTIVTFMIEHLLLMQQLEMSQTAI